jgi:hypothetical protein
LFGLPSFANRGNRKKEQNLTGTVEPLAVVISDCINLESLNSSIELPVSSK